MWFIVSDVMDLTSLAENLSSPGPTLLPVCGTAQAVVSDLTSERSVVYLTTGGGRQCLDYI